MHPYQHIIDQCETAVRGLEGIMPPPLLSECMDNVLKYDEWLLGLEFAIDWIVEEDKKIGQEIFNEFHKAYQLMDRVEDSRLQELKKQISG